MGSVCKPFVKLRRLCIHADVQVGTLGQGLTSLLKLCPGLLQLEIEREHFHDRRAAPDTQYLVVDLDSLEVLDFESFYHNLTLDIRTPNLRSAKLGWEFKGFVSVAAPKLSKLEMTSSAKVSVLAPWEQLERLVLICYSEEDSESLSWDTSGPLREALRRCSKLKSLTLSGQSRGIKDVSGLTERFEGLSELTVHDGTLWELYESTPESLRKLRKLTVSFEHRHTRESMDESRLLKTLRASQCFPKLEILHLEDTGDYTPRAVQALLSFQRGHPGLISASMRATP